MLMRCLQAHEGQATFTTAMNNSSTAFWISSVASGELIETTLPEPAVNEVRVRTLYSGISRGTETLVFSGKVPASEHERMRAPFQEGDFSFPVKYGYINIGIVEQGPAALQGQTVFCLYPHQTCFNVPSELVTVIPANVPPARAVLAANMETAINAIWDAQPCIGDRLSIVGAGVLGTLVAYLASRIVGCEVQLIDINPERAELATCLGLAFALPQSAARDRDIVIHTSASAAGLNCALELAGFEATVLELSWFGSQSPAINLGQAFHSQRLQIKSSQVGHVATVQRSRWTYQRRLALALSLLDDERLDHLISGESAFCDLPATLSWLNTDGNTSLCHRIKYN